MPTIKVSFPPFPPFFQYKDGQPGGYCYDMVATIFDSTYQFEILELPLNRAFNAINTNQIDIMGCMPCDLDGLDNVTYSIPYIREEIIAFYPHTSKAKNKPLKQLKELSGATIRGGLTVRYLSEKKRILLDNTDTIVEFIERGRADYGVLPRSMYQKVLQNHNSENKLEHHTIDTIKACMAISKQSPLVKQMDYINQWLKPVLK